MTALYHWKTMRVDLVLVSFIKLTSRYNFLLARIPFQNMMYVKAIRNNINYQCDIKGQWVNGKTGLPFVV